MKKQKTIQVGIISGLLMLASFLPTVHAADLVERKIDGVWVPTGKQNQWPVAVMIDNHTAARPQAGLQSASIVYEALAEGGIPRFMAIFADTSVKEIGPVRSIRPYFVKWAAEFNAAVAHAGGSPDGLALLKKLRTQTFFATKGPFAKYFYRSHVGGVHGQYTTGAKIQSALKQAGTTKVKPMYTNWKFVDGLTLSERPTGKHGVTLDLGYGRSYTIEYRYDRQRNVYARFTGGRPMTDRNTKKQITIRNILILNVPKPKVLDRKGRLDLTVTGKGSGVLMNNGIKTTIVWFKKNDRAHTQILDAVTRQEMTFVRGNTWVEIVPKGRTYKTF